MTRLRAAVARLVRGLLLLAGVAAVALGLAAAAVPAARRAVSVEAAVAALGSDYEVVAVVALAAVPLAAVVVLERALGGVAEADPPAVEDVVSGPPPGAAFDEGRGDPRERLREAAIRTIVRVEGRSRSAARRRIDEGTWTDDDVAARYLADGRAAATDLLRTVGGRRRRRTAEAVARLSEEGCPRPARPPEDDADGDHADASRDRRDDADANADRPRSAPRGEPR